MHWDVKPVKPLPEYRLYVEIEDGRRGIFDMKPYLERGVFRELQDERYFRRVGILYGAVTWPHEQDIAPETLLVEMAPVQEAPLCRRITLGGVVQQHPSEPPSAARPAPRTPG